MAVGPDSTFPYGRKVSTHRAPKTCTLSEVEVVSMVCGRTAPLNRKTDRVYRVELDHVSVADVVVLLLLYHHEISSVDVDRVWTKLGLADSH